VSLEILHDPRVRSVPWRDLTRLTRLEIAAELLLSLPWLALSLLLAHRGWYVPALLVSFVFFLTGLRQVHNAYHYVLGISRPATEAVMFVLSVLMLGSMHAVQFNHLRHHKHCLDDEDIEGISARVSGWRALLLGPLFPIRLHMAALRHGSRRQRCWIAAELLANVVWVALVFGWLRMAALEYHVIAMAVGQCLTSFFAVWTVHHDCDRSHYIARTLRNRFKSLVTFDMFFHVEHHLYPKVPTCHLAALAERLDRAAPELKEKQVF
jgi:fatty acid desaturase